MIVPTILFLLLQSANSNIKREEDISNICHMEEVDFWKFFYWSFQNCDHLFLETFQTPGTSNIIDNFLNEFLLQLSYHRLYKKSFTISKHYLTIGEDSKEYRLESTCDSTPLDEVNATLEEVLTMVSNGTEENEPELQKRIRSFSSDLNYRYIVLINNKIELLGYLEKDWSKVFPNPRGIFVLLFVSTEELTLEIIQELFKKFWEEYGVLNIIFQQPCICDFKTLYTYDPFYPTEGNIWGLVKPFRIEEALSNPFKYRRSLRRLNWHPLKISMFNKVPTSVNDFPVSLKENHIYKDVSLSLGYIGQDGMVLKTLCELLKLTPLIESTETDYGYELNGKYHGNLAEVANRTIDASFNSRYIEGVGLDVIEYLTPVSNDKFCVIVPKALEVPHYLMIFHCFDWRSWLIISLTYLSASIYWTVVRPVKLSKKKLSSSIVISFIEVFCLFISIPIRLLVTSTNHRIFFVSCMIFSIIIIGAFQGTLVTSFSTTTHYPDIDTLEEFDKSGLLIETASRGVQTVFGDDGSDFFKKLNSKIKFEPTLTKSFWHVAARQDVASLDRKSDANLKIKMFFTTKCAELLHIVKECPRTYHFTYILPKGSPYAHVFNIIITVLRESGLLIKWNSDVVDAFIMESRKKQKSPVNNSREFSLEDMKIAFYILLGGYLLSFLSCFIEVVITQNIFKTKKQKIGLAK